MATPVTLTRWQRANLAKLAAYLRTLPKDYPDFEMDKFTQDGRGFGENFAHKPRCGTAACACGHGPRAGVRPLSEETWTEYSYRAFVSRFERDAWEWAFSEQWSDIDNTVHGAAARIEHLLNYGLPDDFSRSSDYVDFLPLYADRIDAVQS